MKKLKNWFVLVLGAILARLSYGRKNEEGKKMKGIGFTGTRWGMSRLQSEKVEFLVVNAIKEGFDFGSHGDCKGADVQFHQICQKHQLRINIHPPIKDSARAFCKDAFASILPTKQYLERDRNIVNGSKLQIAAPKSTLDKNSGGTWYTANYAIKNGVPTIVVDPNGVCEYHNMKTTPVDEVTQVIEKQYDTDTISVRVSDKQEEIDAFCLI